MIRSKPHYGYTFYLGLDGDKFERQSMRGNVTAPAWNFKRLRPHEYDVLSMKGLLLNGVEFQDDEWAEIPTFIPLKEFQEALKKYDEKIHRKYRAHLKRKSGRRGQR